MCMECAGARTAEDDNIKFYTDAELENMLLAKGSWKPFSETEIFAELSLREEQSKLFLSEENYLIAECEIFNRLEGVYS